MPDNKDAESIRRFGEDRCYRDEKMAAEQRTGTMEWVKTFNDESGRDLQRLLDISGRTGYGSFLRGAVS